MFSVLGASVLLPYVPMAPIQILTNNLLYDFSQVSIPTDEADPVQVAQPRPWSINQITRFILWVDPLSMPGRGRGPLFGPGDAAKLPQ